MENADIRNEFWKLFKDTAHEVGFEKLNYYHYSRLNDIAKRRFEQHVEKKFTEERTTMIDSEDEEFLERIDNINEKLPEKDRITDKDSFFEFAKKADEIEKEEEMVKEEVPIVESSSVIPTETQTDTVKKPSVFKRIGNYFANMSPTSKIANGVAIGLLAASAIFAGPATLLEPVGLVLMAIPAISIGGKALYRSFKNGKIREWINNRKNNRLSDDKVEKIIKEFSDAKSEEIEEDLYKDYELPTEKETIVNPDEVAKDVTETVDEVEREVKKDGLGPKDFILPGEKEDEVSEKIDLPEEDNYDPMADYRKTVKWQTTKEQMEIARSRRNHYPSETVTKPAAEEKSMHVPKHLEKPVDEGKEAKIEELQSRLKTLNWKKEQLAVNTKIKKSEEEMQHEQRAIEANKQAIKEVKKELRKLGITEEKPLSQVLRAKAKKLALKSEKAILENKTDEANSYNYVISEINEYLELEKKYKKVSKILGEESLEVAQLKNALDEKAQKVEFISSSVEDAYNFESRRSRK